MREPRRNATGDMSRTCKHPRRYGHNAQHTVGAVREPPTTAVRLCKNAATYSAFTAAHARSWAVHEPPLQTVSHVAPSNAFRYWHRDGSRTDVRFALHVALSYAPHRSRRGGS